MGSAIVYFEGCLLEFWRESILWRTGEGDLFFSRIMPVYIDVRSSPYSLGICGSHNSK